MHLLLSDQRGVVGQEPLVIYIHQISFLKVTNFWFTLIDYKLTCKTGMFKLYIILFAKNDSIPINVYIYA